MEPELTSINEDKESDQYDNHPADRNDIDTNEMNKSEIIWNISEQIEDRQPIQGPVIETYDNNRWNGDDMDIKTDCTGARIGTLNTQRKLFASEVHWEMMKELMNELNIDILVVTEPGKADEMREAALKNWAIVNGMAAEVAPRNRTSIAGGLVFIINTAWMGIKRTMKRFDTKLGDRGRVCSIEFDNMIEGEHNKLLLIGYYGYNASYRPVEKELVLEMHKWIWNTKAEFKRRNPRAPVILAGDTNAAKRTATDTDLEAGDEEMEADSCTIEHLEEMGFIDPLRERHQNIVILTRREKRVGETFETRRYLDRIMATSEVALNAGTRSGVLQDSIFGAGDTDHMMVVTDVPVDVAGVAITRATLWDVHKVTRNLWDVDDMGRMSQEKISEFNEKARELENTNIPTTASEIMKWLFEAGKDTVILTQEREYPRKVRRLKDFQKKDWTMRRNAKVLRKMQRMLEAGGEIEKSLRRGRKLKDVGESPHSEVKAELRYQKNESRGTVTDKLAKLLETTSEYLKRENRLERARQIKANIERRNKRFEDKGKKKLRDVITSIMRRARVNEQITTQVRRENKGIATGVEEVAREVKKFYQEWMKSRVRCDDRWMSKEGMMHMRLDELKDQTHRKFVEEAYMGSYVKFNKKQDEEGIWDMVMADITMEELKVALKRFKSGKAPGPSGLMFEMLKALDDVNLQPILTLMRQCLHDRALPKELNRSMIRALPKTDQGLAEMCMTRPIALMESLGKLFERILFNRIVKVLAENDMIDLSQHGGMSGRGTTEPIRILAEVMEDAQASGQEFHLFSADLSKAFDTLEYWSQAMSWRALGMPVEITEMLTNLDEGGESEVILGQGRTTSAVLGEEGWFKSGRGVRQGSIGGPIKWIVYMNFWLRYVNSKHEGQGYRMSKDENTVLLAQMYIDDSNWAARSVKSLTSIIESGSNFVNFHGISFNKKKSEYIAMNQDMEGDQWTRPTWPDKTELIETIRVAGKHEDRRATLEKERTERAECSLRRALVGIPEEAVMSMTIETWEELQLKLASAAEAWREGAERCWWRGEPQPGTDEVIDIIRRCRGKDTWAPTEVGRWSEEAENIASTWSESEAERMKVIVKKGGAMRYLGVWFEEGCKWVKQRELLTKKFSDLNERMGRSSPTREQATYCINATINTALKFPLQIANIPRSELRTWDRGNRNIVRRAGYLPTAVPVDLMHLPKKEGGLGLENITEATGRLQIEHYMHFLNGPNSSLAANMTRAGRMRFLETGMPKLSIHARAEKELEDRGMQILEASSWNRGKRTDHFYWFDEQRTVDSADAFENEATGRTWKAYGDGATFPREGVSGWGVWLSDGNEERDGCGRVQGKQSNDGAEAAGILRALLRVNPKDDLDIYCDNTGCISKWGKVNKPGQPTEKWGYRAIWNRIGLLKVLRHEKGARTSMNWVHSHVEEGSRKDSSRSKFRCACLEVGQVECDPLHPHHVGNEKADMLAKEGAWKDGGDDYDEAARGEMWFILRGEDGFAQGAVKEFLREHDDETHLGQFGGDGEGDEDEEHTNWQRASSRMDREVMRMVLKRLDKKNTTTWRFWARTLSGILPTHSRMMKFASTGGREGNYAKVYRGHIGEKGKCVSCEHQEETNKHALWECPAVQRIWDIAKSEIKLNWEEAGADWGRANWLTETTEGGWDTRWSMAGMVPKEVTQNLIEDQDMEPIEALTLVRDTALTILIAAHEAWKWRVKATEEWAKENEHFLACRKAMKATEWRQGAEKKKQVRIESDKVKAKKIRIESMMRAKVAAEETERDKQDEENMRRHKEGRTPAPLKIRREAIKRAGDSAFKAEGEGQKRRALFSEWAEGTRRIEMEVTTAGPNWQAMENKVWGRHEDQKGMWFPPPGTKVLVRSGSYGHEEMGEGIARSLRWEVDGNPEVLIDHNGDKEWFNISRDAGTRIISIGGENEFNSMGARALDLIGHGSEVLVEWEGTKLKTWYKGKIVARTADEITVRYGKISKASVAKHTYEDIENRGFVVMAARRNGEYTNETYMASNHGYGMGCILLTDEGRCECNACERAWIEETKLIEDEDGEVGGWTILGVREGRRRIEERRMRMKTAKGDEETVRRKKRKVTAHKLDQQRNVMTVSSEAFAAGRDGTVSERVLRSATRQNCPRNGEGDQTSPRHGEGDDGETHGGNAGNCEARNASRSRNDDGADAEKGDGGQEEGRHDKGRPETPPETHDKEQSRGESDWSGESGEDVGVVLKDPGREEGDPETNDRMGEYMDVSAGDESQPAESGRSVGEDGGCQDDNKIHGEQGGGDEGSIVMDGKERGTTQERSENATGGKKRGAQDGEDTCIQEDGGCGSDVRGHRSADNGRQDSDGNRQRNEREESKRQRMAQGLTALGKCIRVDNASRKCGGHDYRGGVETDADEGIVCTEGRNGRPKDPRHRRRMGVNRNSSVRDTRVRNSGSRQSWIPGPRREVWKNNKQGSPRPVLGREEEHPQESGENSIEDVGVVSDGLDVARMQNPNSSKCDECDERLCEWPYGHGPEELRDDNASEREETGGIEAMQCINIQSNISIERGIRPDMVCDGKSIEEPPVGDGRSEISRGRKRMADSRGRSVCIRTEMPKANENNDEHPMGTKRLHRKGEMHNRQLWGNTPQSTRTRSRETRAADDHERPCQEAEGRGPNWGEREEGIQCESGEELSPGGAGEGNSNCSDGGKKAEEKEEGRERGKRKPGTEKFSKKKKRKMNIRDGNENSEYGAKRKVHEGDDTTPEMGVATDPRTDQGSPSMGIGSGPETGEEGPGMGVDRPVESPRAKRRIGDG